ncbi:AAA family ATPase [Microbacterium sp. gxy059]|uniref:AAA family ATPase n=1 Tax=Microbacterium sp. gxy059 TaxID=2957199 RepID=UPI003D956358
MLTRLEATGFKNLLGFSVDFGPYTCIAGPNAVGKSNIFDAIEFLSALADETFIEAAQSLRGDAGQVPTDISSLFSRRRDGTYRDMELAVECIVDAQVTDDFGREATAQSTFLRYEIGLRFLPPGDEPFRSPYGMVQLLREDLTYIKSGEAIDRAPWLRGRKAFRDSVVWNRRKTPGGFISTTETDDGLTAIAVHQEGNQGRKNTSPAARAPRSVVSTVTTVDQPTILAFRRELQSWRTFALEPTAMRAPDGFSARQSIGADGAHMPATLYRLARQRDDDVESLVADRVSDLVDVRSVSVYADPQRDVLTLRARLGGSDADFPAKSLSDGTLRFLALSTVLFDADSRGVICMEEPENGIHPGKLEGMVRLLRDLAVSTDQPVGPDNPLRQVIVNTHSPHMVSLQNDEELLEAAPVAKREDDGSVRTVRLLAARGTWRDDVPGGERFMRSRRALIDYLSYPPDAPQQNMLSGLTPTVAG